MQLRVRKAQVADHPATRQLVHDAFAADPEGTASFLDALRADNCVLGEWLAEEERGVVAHVAFSRVWVEPESGNLIRAAMLTPLSVRPDRQRSGLGRKLMEHALAELETAGEALFFVLGHPSYYPRVGFRSDLAATIASPWSGRPAFMVRGNDVPTGKLILPRSIAEAH